MRNGLFLLISIAFFHSANAQDTLNVEFTLSGELCNNRTIQFTNNSYSNRAIKSVRWDFGDGFFSSINNPTHTYAVMPNRLKRIVLRITNINDIEDSMVLMQQIDFEPIAMITKSQMCAVPYENTFMGISTDISHEQWIFEDTTINGLSSVPLYRSFQDSGIQTLIYIGINQLYGCRDTFFDTFSIKRSFDGDFSFTPVHPCLGDNMEFTSHLPAKDTADNTYIWYIPFGPPIQNENKAYFNAPNIPSSYNVTLGIQNDQYCTFTKTKSVEVRNYQIKKYFIADSISKSGSSYFKFVPSVDSLVTLVEYKVRYDWVFYKSDTDSLVFQDTDTLFVLDSFTNLSGYKVKMTSTHSSGCTSDVDRIFGSYKANSSHQLRLRKALQIYPIPSKDYLMINVPLEMKSNLSIYNVQGQSIGTLALKPGLSRYDLNLLTGLYVLQLSNGESYRLVIQK